MYCYYVPLCVYCYHTTLPYISVLYCAIIFMYVQSVLIYLYTSYECLIK